MALDIVKVRNLGETDHVSAYNGERFVIRAGGELTIEREAAVKDFGNWEARNFSQTDARLRHREREFRRVRGLYGVHEGAKIPVRGPDGGPVLNKDGIPEETLADTVYRERLPKVEIYLMDGTKVTSVIEDPEGKDLPLDDAPAGDQVNAIASLQAQIKQMEGALSSLLDKQTQIEIPTDSPQPKPKASKPKVVSAQSVGE